MCSTAMGIDTMRAVGILLKQFMTVAHKLGPSYSLQQQSREQAPCFAAVAAS